MTHFFKPDMILSMIGQTQPNESFILQGLEPSLSTLVNWCTAANTQAMKDGVVDGLLRPDSNTRVIVTTSLLSMGVDMKGM